MNITREMSYVSDDTLWSCGNHGTPLEDPRDPCPDCEREIMEDRYNEYVKLCANGDVTPMSFEEWQEWDTHVYQKHVREAASPLEPATFQRLQETKTGPTREELEKQVEELRSENESLIEELGEQRVRCIALEKELGELELTHACSGKDLEQANLWKLQAEAETNRIGKKNIALQEEIENLQALLNDVEPTRTTPANQPLYPHYFREVPNVTHVDVNWVLEAWDVGHTVGHAVKKLLCAGQRGAKDKRQDYEEAINSVKRAIELEETK